MKTKTKSLCALVTLYLALLHAADLEAQRGYTATDLGTLGNGHTSYALALNNQGQVVGYADTGEVDPNSGAPIIHGFLWENGVMRDLGTLVGDKFSTATAINERGWVVVNSSPNTDPTFDLFVHSFLWEKGAIQEVGQTGDTFTSASALNSRGQVTGSSDLANPDSHIPHAFLWDRGFAQDLGTLGGLVSYANSINNRSQVVGESLTTLIDPTFGFQLFHAFLSEKGGPMQDLGTLGGPASNALDINSGGLVVGFSDTVHQDPTFGYTINHAFLWDRGDMQDLGALPGDNFSYAFKINARGQVLGTSTPDFFNFRNFLWERGKMTDVISLISPDSLATINYFFPSDINDRGEIAGVGFPNGEIHAVLLTPSNGDGKTLNESREISKVQASQGSAILPKYRSAHWKLMQKRGLDRFFEGKFASGMRVPN
jgi:probable HAF family extracellular repeat protein